jgi:HNH endonuclease
MTKPRNDLSAEFVRSILKYNPKTGNLVWKINMPPRGKKGHIAGGRANGGYITIGINGKRYFAHRLAFLIMEGRWPEHIIDHRLGRTGDNRWDKIRPVTPSQSSQNRGPQRNNKSGYKGIYWYTAKNKWSAFIKTKDTGNKYLGLFKTQKEAIAAYKQAAVQLHGEFARFK